MHVCVRVSIGVMLVLAACGSDDPSIPAAAPPPSTPAPAPTPTTSSSPPPPPTTTPPPVLVCTPCEAGFFETEPCSATSDRVCAPCKRCEDGTFETAACTASRNRACTACSTCPAGDFETHACTATADRACQTCTACAAGTFETRSCGATSDRVCSPCSPCLPGSFETRACTASTNRACEACTSCGPGTFETTACTATSDASCAACAVCAPPLVELTACTAATDRSCGHGALIVLDSAYGGSASVELLGPLATVNGDLAPSATFTSSAIDGNPTGLAYDQPRGLLYVATEILDTITVFPIASSGATLPTRTMSGFLDPSDVVIDSANDRLYVSDFAPGFVPRIVIIDHASTVSGPIPATARVVTAIASGGVLGLALDPTHDRLVAMLEPTSGPAPKYGAIAIYDHASTMTGPSAANVARTITGAATTLSRPTKAYLDPTTQKLIVTDLDTGNVLAFDAATDDGDVAPAQSKNFGRDSEPFGIAYDSNTDELYVALAFFGTSPPSEIQVFDHGLEINEPQSPVRTLTGDDTGLSGPTALAFDR